MDRKRGGGFGIIIVLVILFVVFRGKIADVIDSIKMENMASSIYEEGLDSGTVAKTLKEENDKLKKQYDGAKIQVLVVKSLAGYDIKEYTKEHFKTEGLDDLPANNGLLLVVALDEKQIANYYGAALADEMAGELALELKNKLMPAVEAVTDQSNLESFNSAMKKTIRGVAKILGNYCAKINSNKED